MSSATRDLVAEFTGQLGLVTVHQYSQEPVKEGSGGVIAAILMGLFGCVLIVIGLFGLVAAPWGEKWHGIVMIAIGAPLIPGAFRLNSNMRKKSAEAKVKRSVVMFEKGILHVSGDATDVFSWDELADAVFVKQSGFLATMNAETQVIILRRKDGKELKIGTDLGSENMWWEALHHTQGKNRFVNR